MSSPQREQKPSFVLNWVNVMPPSSAAGRRLPGCTSAPLAGVRDAAESPCPVHCDTSSPLRDGIGDSESASPRAGNNGSTCYLREGELVALGEGASVLRAESALNQLIPAAMVRQRIGSHPGGRRQAPRSAAEAVLDPRQLL